MLNATELTKKLIQLNTINPPGNEKIIADYISSLFLSLNVHIVEHIFDEGRSGLILTVRGEKSQKPPLAFTGHLDTVPLGSISWDFPPLEACCKEDKIGGRGSSDMKSGLGAFLAAVYNHVDILKKGFGAICILTACEEQACQGAKKMAKDGILPKKLGPLIIAEPTGNKIHIGHKGVFWSKLTFKGTAAHGSMPQEGKNAIEEAILFIEKLKKKIRQIPKHPDFGDISLNIGTIKGGSGINLVADSCQVQLDMRLTPSLTVLQMEEIIQDCFENFEGSYEIIDSGDCVYTDKNTPALKLFAESVQKAGSDGKLYNPLTFFTDASPLLSVCETSASLIFGPGEAEQCHKVNEFAYISKIQQAYEIYSQFIKDYNQ